MFVAAYAAFKFSHPLIISVNPSPLTLANANPWVLRYIHEQDGIELYVATLGLFVFLILANIRIPASGFGHFISSSFCGVVGIVGAAVIVATTWSSEFVGPTRPLTSFLVLAIAITTLLIIVRGSAHPIRFRWLLWIVGGLASAFIFLSASGPAPADYGYFIGPAARILRAEPMGSFFMQYDLLGTLMFAAMMTMSFSISGMEATVVVVTVLWFLFYLAIATKLFVDRQIGLLFFCGVFLTRFLWLNYHPGVYPQGAPFRIDIWVPLLIVAWKFGFKSPVTSAAFGAGWILDSVFGLFALSAYVLTIVYEISAEFRARRTVVWGDYWGALVALVLSFLVNTFAFGGTIPEAAMKYQNIQLGFIPIATHSLFWPVLLALGFATRTLLSEPGHQRRVLGFFVVVMSAFQLIYFFGRSHDHNLLTVSGSWMLALFLAWESRLSGQTPRRRLLLPAVCCALIAFVAGPRIRAKAGAVVIHVSAANAFPRQSIDKQIDKVAGNWPSGDSSVLLLAADDAYWNYRLHFGQHPYFDPLFVSVFRDEMTGILLQTLKRGRKVLINQTIPADWIEALNNDPGMRARKERLSIRPVNGLLRQLVLDSTALSSK